MTDSPSLVYYSKNFTNDYSRLFYDLQNFFNCCAIYLSDLYFLVDPEFALKYPVFHESDP